MMEKCGTSLTIVSSNRCFGCISGVYVYFSDVLSATILSAGDKMCAAAGVESNNEVVDGDEEAL